MIKHRQVLKTFKEYLMEEEKQNNEELQKWKDIFEVEDDTSVNALLGLLSAEVDIMENAVESVEQINKIILAVAKPENRSDESNKFYVSEEDLKNFLGFDDQLVEIFKIYASEIFNKQHIVDKMPKQSLLISNKQDVQHTKTIQRNNIKVQTKDTVTPQTTNNQSSSKSSNQTTAPNQSPTANKNSELNQTPAHNQN